MLQDTTRIRVHCLDQADKMLDCSGLIHSRINKKPTEY